MRKLKLQMQISVDGFVAGTNGGLDWMTRTLDDKLLQRINSITDSSNTILLGRKMTDGFVSHWESALNSNPNTAFAKKMVEIPKVVFTKTLDKVAGKNI